MAGTRTAGYTYVAAVHGTVSTRQFPVHKTICGYEWSCVELRCKRGQNGTIEKNIENRRQNGIGIFSQVTWCGCVGDLCVI